MGPKQFEHAAPRSSARAIATVAIGLGLALSTYLALAESGTLRGPGCPLDDISSCLLLLSGPDGRLLGVPLPQLGVVGYGTALMLGLASLKWPRAVLAFGILADALFVVSCFLIAKLVFKVHSLCPWCLASAALSTGGFVAGSNWIGRDRRSVAWRAAVTVIASLAYGGLVSWHAKGAPASPDESTPIQLWVARTQSVARLADATAHAATSHRPALLFVYDLRCPRCSVAATAMNRRVESRATMDIDLLSMEARDDLGALRRYATSLPVLFSINGSGHIIDVVSGSVTDEDVGALLAPERR